MGPMMVAAGWKLLGQTLFVAAVIICFALHEREAGMLLVGMAGGSLVPVAEKHAKALPAKE